MADISKISPDGGQTILNIKDSTARSSISGINEKIPDTASASNKLATANDIPTVPDLGLVVDNGKLCVRYSK